MVGFCNVIYSGIISIASLALFLRLVEFRHTWLDSLSKNSYAIYIVHYPFVIWCQYVLLNWSMAAEAKALIVITVSIGLSWGVSALLRSIPGVRAVL